MRRAPAIDGVAIEQLLRLADGTLPAEQREAVEARVIESANASEMLQAQRRAVAAVRAFAPPAPAGLEARVRAGAVRPRRGPRRFRLAIGAVCAGAAAVALAIVISPAGGVTVNALADVSTRPALELPGPPSAVDGELRRSFAGVTFPDWSRARGWRAVGARRDRVDGRATDTVYYRHMDRRIGYTVLSGSALALPDRGRRVERAGVVIQLYRDGPRTVAVFDRDGHTCVLAGDVPSGETLVKLASWRAKGALTF